jgi:hypothetical protein
MDDENIRTAAEHRFIQALIDGDMSSEELMLAYDITTSLADIGPETHAFVCHINGMYHILINKYLSPGAQRKALFHELYHIIVDCPNNQRIVGFDQHQHVREEAADMFYNLAVEARKKKTS